MWHIGNITTDYFIILSVNVTLQFSCVTAVILYKGMFLSSYSEHHCRCKITCYNLCNIGTGIV